MVAVVPFTRERISDVLAFERELRRQEPDGQCQCLEDFLPGCVVTVCPADGPVRTVSIASV